MCLTTQSTSSGLWHSLWVTKSGTDDEEDDGWKADAGVIKNLHDGLRRRRLIAWSRDLSEIRNERRPNSRYASLENCRHEVSEAEAMSLSVNGFINDLAKEFPMEYSVELKRLIYLEMDGSVG